MYVSISDLTNLTFTFSTCRQSIGFSKLLVHLAQSSKKLPFYFWPVMIAVTGGHCTGHSVLRSKGEIIRYRHKIQTSFTTLNIPLNKRSNSRCQTKKISPPLSLTTDPECAKVRLVVCVMKTAVEGVMEGMFVESLSATVAVFAIISLCYGCVLGHSFGISSRKMP